MPKKNRVYYDEDSLCATCSDRDHCDGWEAQFCRTIRRWLNYEPDCDNCDTMDI